MDFLQHFSRLKCIRRGLSVRFDVDKGQDYKAWHLSQCHRAYKDESCMRRRINPKNTIRLDTEHFVLSALVRVMKTFFFICVLFAATAANAQEGVTTEDVAQAILEYTQGAECRHYCTDERRAGAPDRSDYVVTHEDALAMAGAMLQHPEVPLHTLLGTAAHESAFQRYAVGSSGECGIYQQNARFVPEYLALANGCEERGECSAAALSAICDDLQDPAVAVEVFAWQYARLNERFTESYWECAYNQGASTLSRAGSRWICNADGRDYQEENHRFESWLFQFVAMEVASREEAASVDSGKD